MSAKTGVNIKDPGNLAFYVDAANPNSYKPDSYPTTLFSMVPGGKDAQLYGTTNPYYTTQYGGGMSFQTSSQQYFRIDPVPLTTQSFAVEVWFKAGKGSTANGGNAWETIIGCGDVVSSALPPVGYRGWSITYISNSTQVRFGVNVTSSAGPAIVGGMNSGLVLTVGQVYNLLLQRNTVDQTLELYNNGTLWQSVTLNNTGSLDGSPNQIGTMSWKDGPGEPYMNHTYYSMKMYTNTQFTADEVQQNFNAVRNKFRI